jgi:hypothetical protein
VGSINNYDHVLGRIEKDLTLEAKSKLSFAEVCVTFGLIVSHESSEGYKRLPRASLL